MLIVSYVGSNLAADSCHYFGLKINKKNYLTSIIYLLLFKNEQLIYSGTGFGVNYSYVSNLVVHSCKCFGLKLSKKKVKVSNLPTVL